MFVYTVGASRWSALQWSRRADLTGSPQQKASLKEMLLQGKPPPGLILEHQSLVRPRRRSFDGRTVGKALAEAYGPPPGFRLSVLDAEASKTPGLALG